MSKPIITDYPANFAGYINQVPEDDLEQAFFNQREILPVFFLSITEEKSLFTYAEGKWTLREMLQHIIDAERIFNYRALCISRKESVSLPSFDENIYAANSHANKRSWQSLVDEFFHVRISSEDLYKSFTDEMLVQKGMANYKPINVVSIGFITVGHIYHHKKIIEQRYFGLTVPV
ncbi:MAG: DinB family protein [Chitinophagaceae bacterium]|nr:DinB family protein [Chitinophagaceae bacterium]